MPAKTTPTIDAPNISTAALDHYIRQASEPLEYATADAALDRYAAALNGRELPPSIAAALALRARQFDIQAPEAPADVDVSGAVAALVRGEMSPEQAAERAVEAERAKLDYQAAETVYERATALCRVGAVKMLGGATEDQLLPPLRGALAAVLAEAREIAPAAAGIADDAGALRAAPEAREAWLKLAQLRSRVASIVGASMAVRPYIGRVEQRPAGAAQDDPDSTKYGYLSSWIVLDRDVRNAVAGAGIGVQLNANRAPGAEVRSFADAVQADHGLGIFTAEQAIASYKREAREERAAQEEPEKRGHRPQRAPNTWI